MDDDKRIKAFRAELKKLADALRGAGRSSIWDEAKYYLRDAAEIVSGMGEMLK